MNEPISELRTAAPGADAASPAGVPESLAVAAPPSTLARDRVSAIAYPLATFTLLLLAWQFLVRLFGVPEYILPVPSEFLVKLVESRGLIWQHTLVTANEILMGFLLAAIVGVPLGLMIVSIKFLQSARRLCRHAPLGLTGNAALVSGSRNVG